jgi:hypothetical protein
MGYLAMRPRMRRNQMDIVGLWYNSVVVTRMVRKDMSDGFKVYRRLKVGRGLVRLHVFGSQGGSWGGSPGSRSVGIRSITVEL